MFYAVESYGMNSFPAATARSSSIVAFENWLEEIDKTPATGWRWRKKGWIKTLNICGRLYVSRAAIAEFEQRAAAGEFAKVHQTPRRKRGTTPAETSKP